MDMLKPLFMKRLYFLFIPAILTLLAACGGKNNSPVPNNNAIMLVGKWSLQTQKIVQYINGQQQPPISLAASNKNAAYAQFNQDGTYTSVSLYNSDGIGSTQLSAVYGEQTLGGNYSFSGSAFSLSTAGLAGLSDDVLVPPSSNTTVITSIPTIKIISQSAQITQLTSSVLTLHTEYTTLQTIASVNTNYKYVQDYYYTRQ